MYMIEYDTNIKDIDNITNVIYYLMIMCMIQHWLTYLIYIHIFMY